MLKWLAAQGRHVTPAVFESRYSLTESAARLAAAVEAFSWQSFPREAVVGRVSVRQVEISRRRRIRNSFKPYFYGAFTEQDGQVRLVGHFEMHWSARVFAGVWFGLGLLWLVGTSLAAWIDPAVPWSLPLWGLALMLYGVSIVSVGRLFSRSDVDWLSARITQVLS